MAVKLQLDFQRLCLSSSGYKADSHEVILGDGIQVCFSFSLAVSISIHSISVPSCFMRPCVLSLGSTVPFSFFHVAHEADRHCLDTPTQSTETSAESLRLRRWSFLSKSSAMPIAEVKVVDDVILSIGLRHDCSCCTIVDMLLRSPLHGHRRQSSLIFRRRKRSTDTCHSVSPYISASNSGSRCVP